MKSETTSIGRGRGLGDTPEAGRSRLVGGSFEKQREPPTRDGSWVAQQEKWILTPAHQVLRVDKEAVAGCRCIHGTGLLRAASPPEACPRSSLRKGSREGKENPPSKEGRGVRRPPDLGGNVLDQQSAFFTTLLSGPSWDPSSHPHFLAWRSSHP